MSGQVFISHASANADVALSIADRLRTVDLKPLLDRERLLPGESILTFMEDGLSTSDYFLLLWSVSAATRKWVQLEWEAALYRSVTGTRSFLVVGRLDEHPLPALLAPRLFVTLHPTIDAGVDELIEMWRTDRLAEARSERPIASNERMAAASGGSESVYITSDLFGVTTPVRAELAAPSGVLLDRIREQLGLPEILDYSGRIGVRFEYRLVENGRHLDPTSSLREQGIHHNSLLWLECEMSTFAAKPARSGLAARLVFRWDSPEHRLAALRAARDELASRIAKADLGADAS